MRFWFLAAGMFAGASGLAWAGSVPTVTSATLTADKTKVTADNAALTKDKQTLAADQKVLQADVAKRTANLTSIAANNTQIATLEQSLSAALAKHDYTSATKIQAQLTTLRTANAKLQASDVTLNSTIRADQAAVNSANEKVILDNRQLGLDSSRYSADQYWAAIGK